MLAADGNSRCQLIITSHSFGDCVRFSVVNLLELFCNGSLDFSPLTVEMTQRSVKIFPRCRADTGVALGRQSRLQHTSQKVLQTKAMISGLGLRFPQKLVRKIECRSHATKIDQFASRSRPELASLDSGRSQDRFFDRFFLPSD